MRRREDQRPGSVRTPAPEAGHTPLSPGVSVDSDALPAAGAGAGAGPGRAQGRGGRAPVRGRTHRAQTFLLPRGL